MLNKSLMVIFPCVLMLSGCSVFMAAHKTGVDSEQLAECRTRSCCIISKGGDTASLRIRANGALYRVVDIISKRSAYGLC